MKNKKIIFSLFFGFILITSLFSEETQVLWELGVVIYAPIQNIESSKIVSGVHYPFM